MSVIPEQHAIAHSLQRPRISNVPRFACEAEKRRLLDHLFPRRCEIGEVLILEGESAPTIAGEEVQRRKGDAVYVPQLIWHSVHNVINTTQALYLAWANAPRLLNLYVAQRGEA